MEADKSEAGGELRPSGMSSGITEEGDGNIRKRGLSNDITSLLSIAIWVMKIILSWGAPPVAPRAQDPYFLKKGG